MDFFVAGVFCKRNVLAEDSGADMMRYQDALDQPDYGVQQYEMSANLQAHSKHRQSINATGEEADGVGGGAFAAQEGPI